MKRLAIITGASKGIGAALTRTIINQIDSLILISRSTNSVLKAILDDFKVNYSWIEKDLCDIQNLALWFTAILSDNNSRDFDDIWLFNNAGMLEPVNTIGKLEDVEIINHINLNVLAPIVLSNAFISYLPDNLSRKIIFTGSGAANVNYHGWSIYGSGKAALHRFAETLQIEQKMLDNPAIIRIFNPGRTDTDMQTQIRNTSSDKFQAVQSFIDAWEDGKLNDPNRLAEQLIPVILNAKDNNQIYIIPRDLGI